MATTQDIILQNGPSPESWLGYAWDNFYDWSNAILKFNPTFAKPIGKTFDVWGAVFYASFTLAALYAIKKSKA